MSLDELKNDLTSVIPKGKHKEMFGRFDIFVSLLGIINDYPTNDFVVNYLLSDKGEYAERLRFLKKAEYIKKNSDFYSLTQKGIDWIEKSRKKPNKNPK